jgi:hypothetical protein
MLRNSEGVALAREFAGGDATPSGLRLCVLIALSPGLPQLNPGLKLANAFSVIKRGGCKESRFNPTHDCSANSEKDQQS